MVSCMFSYFVIFQLLLFSTKSDNSCSNLKSGDVVDYSVAEECLRSVPFNKKRKHETLDFVSKILEYYVFKDIILDSGPPWNQKIDIFDDLEQLRSRNDFASDYDFHNSLRATLSRLRDSHLAYIPPKCYWFFFYQPFPLHILPNGDVVVGSYTDYKDFSMFKIGLDTRFSEWKNLKGIKITSIDGKPIYEYLRDFSDEECSYSRDQHVRFNQVIKNDFHERITTRMSIPESPSVLYTFSSGKEIEVPWIGVPYIDYNDRITLKNKYGINNENPMDYDCGYKELPKEEKPRATGFFKGNNNGGFFQYISYLKKLYDSEFLYEKFQDEISYLQRNVEREKTNVFEITNNLWRKIADKRRSSLNFIFEKTPKGFRKLELPHETGSVNRYFRLYINTNNQEIALLKVFNFHPADVGDDDNDNEEITKMSEKDIYIEQLHEAFVIMKTQKIGKIIIDVRGNTGGLPHLGFVLANYISPYSPKSTAFTGDEVYGEFMDHHHCRNDFYKLILTGKDREPVSHDWYSSGPTRIRGGRKGKYSKLVHFNMELFLSSSFRKMKEKLRKKGLYVDRPWRNSSKMFEPEDILIFTDGTCGSTCGEFVRLFQSLKLGKIISQGGDPNESGPMNAVSFPGGNIVKGEVFSSFSDDKEFCPIPEHLKITKPQTSAIITFPIIETYLIEPMISAFELEKVNTLVPSDFILKPADFHINNWDFGDDILSDPLLLDHFDRCATWEIKRDDKGCKKYKKSIEHSVYGHPCVNGKFNEKKCVLRGCERGFYLTEESVCKEMPKESIMVIFSQLLKIPIIRNIIMNVLVGTTSFLFSFCCLCCGCGIGIIMCCVCINREVLSIGIRKKDEEDEKLIGSSSIFESTVFSDVSSSEHGSENLESTTTDSFSSITLTDTSDGDM